MSRCRTFLVAGLVAVAGLAAAAPSASAQAQTQEHGSCLGVLSAFAGSQQNDAIFRQDFAPAPGALVSGGAQLKGDLTFCATLVPMP
jgi:hypothetical protein